MSATFLSAILANTGGSYSTTVVTAPFSLSGTNRALGVLISITSSTSRSISSVSRGSDTFSQIGQEQTGSIKGFVWGSTNEPQTASAALTVTGSAGSYHFSVCVFAATGVDQTTRINGFTANPDISGPTADNMSVATTTGDLVCDGVGGRNDWSAATPNGSQTYRGYTESGGTAGSDKSSLIASTLPGSGSSVLMGWANGNPGGSIKHLAFNFVQAVTATAPNQVTGLSVSAYSPEKFKLSWSTPGDGGSPITGYKIEVSDDGVGWSVHTANTGNTNTTAYPGGYNPATLKYWRVSAINAIGTGPASTSASATTPNQGDAEQIALINFNNLVSEPTVPFYGAGTWSQQDIQQILSLPIDPLVAEIQGTLLLRQFQHHYA